jgi:hypothetical protein
MPDLDEQIRAYFDALTEADPAQVHGAESPIAGSMGRSSRFGRRLLAAGAAAVLIAASLTALLREGPSSEVVTVPSTSRPADFVPNEGVEPDLIQTQAMGATVVVPATDGLYLTAVREGEFVCLQLNPTGRGDGPRSCDMPASAAWPDGPIFARQVALGDRKFAIGAADAKHVAEVAVDGPGATSRKHLDKPGMPFPTLRFFVLEAGGAHAVEAFGPTGRRLASTVLRPNSDARPQTATTVGGASIADVNVGRTLAAFAFEPSEDTFRAIPFADGRVRLLYQGEPVSGFASADELADPSVWEVDTRAADGGTEPVSALTVLRGHAQNDLGFSPGPYTFCATSPEPVEFAYDEHVIIEPDSIDSCSDWFGVDLYLAHGRIVAVGLVLPTK